MSEEGSKIAHSVEEVEQLLKQGFEVELFLEKKDGIWVMKKPELYEPTPEEIEKEEEEAEFERYAREIVDVREVPPEKVKDLVEQGWQVNRVYKGMVSMILQRRKTWKEEKEEE